MPPIRAVVVPIVRELDGHDGTHLQIVCVGRGGVDEQIARREGGGAAAARDPQDYGVAQMVSRDRGQLGDAVFELEGPGIDGGDGLGPRHLRGGWADDCV